MLKQRFLVQFGSEITIKIITFVAGIFVARIAGPEVVGTLAYATAYVSIFGFITGIFSTGHIKLISDGEDIGDKITTFTILQSSSIFLFFSLVLGWYLIQKNIFGQSFDVAEQSSVILVTLFAITLTKFVEFCTPSFTAQLKQAKANLTHLVKGLTYQVGRILVVIFGFRALGLANWNLITSAIVLPITYKLYKQLPKGNFNKAIAKQYVAYGIPIILVVVVNHLLKFSDKLLLQEFTNTKELGYYSAAYALGGMILMVGTTIGTVFFPYFSSSIKKSDWFSVNSKIDSFERFITTFVFPIVILLAIIAKPFILLLLGEKYSPSVVPFTLLIFASYFMIVGLPYGNIIPASGKFYLHMWLKVANFIIYVISLFIFISPFFFNLGAVGLALNTLVVNLSYALILFFASKRIGEIRLDFRNLIRYLIILLISLIVYYFATITEYHVNFWWLVLIPVYLFILYSVLFITGYLEKSQITEFLDLLNIKKVINYFIKEIKEK